MFVGGLVAAVITIEIPPNRSYDLIIGEQLQHNKIYAISMHMAYGNRQIDGVDFIVNFN